MVTGFSWYPKWQKRPEDRRKLFRTDFYKGIKVLRGYLYVPKKVTTITRMLQEITFLTFAFFNFMRAGKHDAIVLFTTPINLGLIGVLFRKLWGAKLIINVQDLQLDAAKSLGMLGKLPIVETMGALEKYSYHKSDMVASISTAMTDLIRQKDIPSEKIYLWPNWISVADANAQGQKQAFRNKFPQYRDKIIVGYAGNVGIKQGLSVLIDLCKRFEEQSDLVFLIIGQGGDIDNLKRYAQQQQVKNLDFIDFLSQEDYFHFLTDADIVFLSQKKDSGDVYFPSKLLGIMAKEKLIMVSADKDSEIYKVVTSNKVGLSADFGDIDYMERLLHSYLRDRPAFDTYKSNAYRFVHQYDREPVLQDVFTQIERLQANLKISINQEVAAS
jgi:colanic acid biosynthesis glycosyl transferase WcaI